MQDIHAWRRPNPTDGASPLRSAAAGGLDAPDGGAKSTEVFFKHRRLGPEDSVTDGFRDAGGASNPSDGASTSANQAILLVDRKQDRRLCDLLQNVTKKLQKAADPVTKIMAAALLVSEVLGRSNTDVGAIEQQCESVVVERLGSSSNGMVLLGELLARKDGGPRQGAGGSRYRAVLLKSLADWLGLHPSALCRDAKGTTWNEVTFDNSTYLVDVMLDPGAMYETGSARATDYLTRLEKKGLGGKDGKAAPSVTESTSGAMVRPPWHVEPWEVEFDRSDRAGRGGFGEVFCGSWAGQQVAVKEVRDASPTDGDVCDFVLEISLLSGLSHPHIVRFWRGCVDLRRGSRALLLVTEWMDRGVLSALLHEAQDPVLSVGWSLALALGIGRGVSYLHEVGVLHLDLKSPNVLLNKGFQAKLCDFGLAKVREQVGAHTTLRGVSPVWAPPEMFDDTVGTITEKADVYSFGIIVLEIFARQLPFSDVNPMHLTRIKSKGQLPEMPSDLDTDIIEFIKICLSQRPSSRQSMKGAITQIQKLAKQRNLDLQKEKESMETHGLNSNGPGGLKSDKERKLEAEEKGIQAEIARLKKQIQEEARNMKLLEDQIRKKAFESGGEGEATRRLEEFCRKHSEQLDGVKYRCTICMKLFRGEEFVFKHIREKHFSTMLMGMAAPEVNKPAGVQKKSSDEFFDTDVANEANARMYTNKIAEHQATEAVLDAAKSGDMAKVQRLIRQDASALSVKDAEGCQSLHLSSMNGHVDLVRYLLSNSVDVADRNDNGLQALHLAAQEGHVGVCEVLLQAGALFDVQDEVKLRTPLHLAAANGHLEPCRILLAHKASVDVRDSEGGSALHNAARFGSCALCEELLSWGAAVNGKDNDGWCPLHEAARWGDGDLVMVLLARGADLNAASNDGETALHVVPGGYAEHEVVEVLLERSANVNAADYEGETPLHVAVKLGDDNFVGVMLNSGADANAKTKSGLTPLDLAKKDEIRWLLRSHKAKKGAGG